MKKRKFEIRTTLGKRTLLLVGAALLLSGCNSDKRQQLAKCQLKGGDQVQEIQLCMLANGYELIEKSCPSGIQTTTISRPDSQFYKSLTNEQKDQLNTETGKKIIAMEEIQKLLPACYEPIGWTGRMSARLEKWLGAN